jgi:hypothetical protein
MMVETCFESENLRIEFRISIVSYLFEIKVIAKSFDFRIYT